MILVKLVLISLTVAAFGYYLVCILAATRFFSESRTDEVTELPPVSIMIPLHGVDSEAYTNYAAFCTQDYPTYQIVFGVRDRHDPVIPVVRKLMSDFPSRDIELVICPDTIGTNLKVSNLKNMLARVKHEYLVIVDSDIRVGADYLRSVIPPLCDHRVGLVTCVYTAATAPNWAARLEAIGMTAEFMPGVLVARQVEGMTFALGATMAMTKGKLDAIGGFEAVASHLADDYMLGHLMARAGFEVRLSRYAVRTTLGPAKLSNMVKHQIRWARGTRVCRPLGFYGLILTYGTTTALLTAAAFHFSKPSLILVGATLLARWAMGWLVGVAGLGDRILKKNFWLLPVRDVLSVFIWTMGLFGKTVEWRGNHFYLADDGTLVPVS